MLQRSYLISFLICISFFNNVWSLDTVYNPNISAACNPLFPNPSGITDCNERSFSLTKDLNVLPQGSTTMDYNLAKDIDAETASIVLNYAYNGFSTQFLGSYEKDMTSNDGITSDATIKMKYQMPLFDSIETTISENIFLPGPRNPTSPSYTSIMKINYSLNDTYSLFAKNSYTYMENKKIALLCDPYSYEGGISYKNDPYVSMSASYSEVKDQDLSIGNAKTANLTFKHKIGKKLKTALTIRKSFTSSPQENKASIKINYGF